jgi:hypothetical protein
MSKAAVEEMSQSIHDLSASQTARAGKPLPEDEPSQNKSAQDFGDILLQIKKSQDNNLLQLRQLLIQDEIGANLNTKAFDWMKYKPNHLFHPVSKIRCVFRENTSLLTGKRNGGSKACMTHLRFIILSKQRMCLFVLR